MNSAWFGGQKTIVIGFDLGKRMSNTRFSISFQCRVLVLKQRSFLMSQGTPPPFLCLSHRGISYPGKFASESGTVWSNFDSVIPIIAPVVILTMHLISSSFKSKLLMFICRKCKPFFVDWFLYCRAYIWRSLNWSRVQTYIFDNNIRNL